MNEKGVWKVIRWTLIATTVVVLLILFDPGFLSGYLGNGVIALTNGDRVEILAITTSPLGGSSGTDLYWLKADGAFEKAASFDPPTHCVTAFDGKLFITFRDQSSGIIEDGKYVRGVSPPAGFRIDDVVSLRGSLYALNMLNGDAPPPAPGMGIRLAVLGDDGWEEFAPVWQAGREIRFFGCVEVAGGIEVLFAEGESGLTGMLDPDTLKWFHILFDGAEWGEEQPLDIPSEVFPGLGAYGGRLAFVLIPREGNKPVRLAFESDGGLEPVADIAQVEKGRVLGAWIVEPGGDKKVILFGGSAVWVADIDDSTPAKPRKLMEISAASKTRSYLYVGILAVGSVMLVALGVAWLVMRLPVFKRGGRGE